MKKEKEKEKEKENENEKSGMGKVAKLVAGVTLTAAIGAGVGAGVGAGMGRAIDIPNVPGYASKSEFVVAQTEQQRAIILAHKILDSKAREDFIKLFGEDSANKNDRIALQRDFVKNYIESNLSEVTETILKSGEVKISEKEAKEIIAGREDFCKKLVTFFGGLGALTALYTRYFAPMSKVEPTGFVSSTKRRKDEIGLETDKVVD